MAISPQQFESVTASSVLKIPEAIFWYNQKGRILYVNEYASIHLGYHFDELTMMFLWDIDPLISPEDIAYLWDTQRTSYRTIESIHRKKSGEIVPVIIMTTYECVDGMDVRVAHVRDISMLKQKEEQIHAVNLELTKALSLLSDELQGTQRLLKDVFNGLDLAISLIDMTTYEILFVNDYVEKHFGKVTGTTCYRSLFSNQETPCEHCTNKQLLSQDGIPLVPHIWEHYNTDHKKWYYDIDRAIMWDGRLVRLEISLDITERKQMEKELEEQKNLLRQIIDEMPSPFLVKDYHGKFVITNKAVAHLYGVQNPEDMVGKDNSDYIPDKKQAEYFRQNVKEIMDVGETRVVYEDSYDVNTKKQRHFMSIKKPFVNQKGEKQIIVLANDITEIKQAEARLLQYQKIMSVSHDFLAYQDTNGVYQAVNDTYINAFGLTRDEIIGKSAKDLLGEEHYFNFVKPHFDRAIAGENVTYRAWTSYPAIGKRFVEVSFYPYYNESTSTIEGVVIKVDDITDHYEAEEKLRHMADHDALTGLPNRRMFSDRLSQALNRARRHHRQVAVLFIDLDRFKVINDSLGHTMGDKVLQEIAALLLRGIRGSDTLARSGGDEFLLLLEEFNHLQDVVTICQHLLESLNSPVSVEGHELFVTASIGVSIFPNDADTEEALIQSADTAMYQAKKMGRNAYQLSNEEMREQVFERFFLENNLRLALEREEFTLFFQPQINMRSNELVGAEVLLRWFHPAMGMISPEKFIPVAEECGLINPLGKWVLETACKQMKTWLDAGFRMQSISVNISGNQLMQSNFVETVQAILAKTRLVPCFLELEITESYLMHDMESVAKELQSLKKLGIRIAIDDFGTSYSSLRYLQQLPISKIKIDRSFIQDIPQDKGDCAIAKTIIDLAHNMELSVVAEGVETKEQESFLLQENCFFAQGFLYGKPIDASNFQKEYFDLKSI